MVQKFRFQVHFGDRYLSRRTISFTIKCLMTLLTISYLISSLRSRWILNLNPNFQLKTFDLKPDRQVRFQDCDRTLSYQLGHQHGFGSEIALYVRVAAIATRLNYTLRVDDQHWNYGSLADYFVLPDPRPNSKCQTSHHLISVDVRGPWPPEWVQYDQVMLPRDVNYIDQLFLGLFVDRLDLESMHELDVEEGGWLDKNATLPRVFDQAFRVQAEALQHLWIPRPELAQAIHQTEVALQDLRQDQSTTIIGVHLR